MSSITAVHFASALTTNTVTAPRKYRIVYPIPAAITALFQHSQLLCQSLS